MNKDCDGTYLPSLGIYRCLGDGTIVRTKKLPDYCPHCKRSVGSVREITDPKLRVKVVTRLEFLDPGWGGDPGTWIAIQEKLIDQLEDYYSQDFKDVGLDK